MCFHVLPLERILRKAETTARAACFQHFFSWLFLKKAQMGLTGKGEAAQLLRMQEAVHIPSGSYKEVTSSEGFLLSPFQQKVLTPG